MPGERFMSEEDLKKWGVKPEDVGGEVLIGKEEKNADGVSLEDALRAEGFSVSEKKKKSLLEWMKGKTQVVALSLVGLVGPGAIAGTRFTESESQPRGANLELVEKKT